MFSLLYLLGVCKHVLRGLTNVGYSVGMDNAHVVHNRLPWRLELVYQRVTLQFGSNFLSAPVYPHMYMIIIGFGFVLYKGRSCGHTVEI